MRSQARKQCRRDMAGRPLQEPGQIGPVRLEAQLDLGGLGSGDDQCVGRSRPQLVKPPVALLDECGDLLRTRNLLDRVELELDPGPVGTECRSPELVLGIEERRVRHVVDERDRDRR